MGFCVLSRGQLFIAPARGSTKKVKSDLAPILAKDFCALKGQLTFIVDVVMPLSCRMNSSDKQEISLMDYSPLLLFLFFLFWARVLTS